MLLLQGGDPALSRECNRAEVGMGLAALAEVCPSAQVTLGVCSQERQQEAETCLTYVSTASQEPKQPNVGAVD